MIDIQRISRISNKPGVYLWKNDNQEVIYVGKAKNLKKRMSQYFNVKYDVLKPGLRNEINDFEAIVTNTEREAIALEANLIWKHSPKFNINLTDDKKYPYIRLELKKILTMRIARRVANDGAFYYGPFVQGGRQVLHLLMHFAFFKNGLPYRNENDFEHWQKSFELCKKILKPNNNKFKKILEQEMKEAARKQNFEIAMDLKKTIDSLDFYNENNDVILDQNKHTDVIGITIKDHYLAIALMSYRYGKLLAKIDHVCQLNSDIFIYLDQFLENYYFQNLVPDQLVLSSKFANQVWSFEIKEIIIPQQGKYKRALKIAQSNALNTLNTKLDCFIRKVERTSGAIEQLAKILKIEKPMHIVMIDNSHMHNERPISAIVSYRNGVKQKNEYRKYNLENNNFRNADVEYMKQGLNRYFERHSYPDLLLIDGGKAQLNEAIKIVQFHSNIAALVKDERHKFRNLINRNGKLIDIKNESVRNFLGEIQVEVDRFARTFYGRSQVKHSLQAQLSLIKGVGQQTIKRLLTHFGTFSAIYNASEKKLMKVVSPKLAANIRAYLDNYQK